MRHNDGKTPETFPTLFGVDEIQVPTETTPQEEEYPFVTVKQTYPRIAAAIELMWGSKELEVYLDRLILDDRGGRAGFPPQVMEALLKLHKQHTLRFKFARTADIWSQDPLRRPGDWREQKSKKD